MAWKATSTARGSSAFSGRIGQRVAAKGVTVLDDGTIADRRGSLNVDDEATQPAQRADRRRHLKGYIQDSLNARLMGVAQTGNGRRMKATPTSPCRV